MYLSDADIADRFGAKRPGLELIAIENAALPVSTLGVHVLAQQEKGLPLLDEFLLRSAREGLSLVKDIARLLGIEPNHLDTAVVSQIAAGNLTYNQDTQSVRLTPRGDVAAVELSSIVPIELEIPTAFDRTIWRAADYRNYDLIKKRDAEEQGMVILPAKQSTTIRSADIRAKDMEAFMSTGRENSRFQILEIVRVRRRTNLYLPVRLLIFSDGQSPVPDFMLLVNGEDSPYHERVISGAGGLSTLGIRTGAAVEESLHAEISSAVDDAASKHPDLFSADEAPVIKQVSVFEHADHLNNALTTAKTRVLVISPWIRRAVVNTAFLANLERRLRAGVSVAIGHGYGPDDSGSDEDAIRRLHNLSRRFPDKFEFIRLPNTHAKVLIYDDTFITTSFNWLSFRGDPERTYRMEEGTLVQSRSFADLNHARYLDVLSAS